MLRALTAEEYAVFSAVVAQHDESPEDYFAYSVKKGQKYLNESDEFRDYRISPPKHIEILRVLTNDGIIDSDWIIEDKTGETTKYRFARNREWAETHFVSSTILIDGNEKDYFYINISNDVIKEVLDNCAMKYIAHIEINKTDSLFFDIVCTEVKNGLKRSYKVKAFNDAKRPYLITHYVMKNHKPNDTALRKELIENVKDNANVNVLDKTVNLPKVYNGSTVILTALSPFFAIKNDGVTYYQDLMISQAQLDAIASVSTN